MPALVDVLDPAAVKLHVRVSSKRQLFNEVAGAAAHAASLDSKAVLAALSEREHLGSTGVGEGVAMPHARIEGLDQLFALFWLLERPIAFDAIDDKPVDLVFVLLVPAGAETEHLKTLAKVARKLRDPGLRSRLRSTDDPKVAWRALTANGSRHEAA
ncbi:MAG: PTS sugar transporter subunit IIA [Alphaproteobacteria bacterium]